MKSILAKIKYKFLPSPMTVKYLDTLQHLAKTRELHERCI